ncbi:MAG: hypothetical protein LBU23_07535 [Planctomycetota bacterium]|jgi:hypothetical protein|nr:hypothetical protein [Planctomycetota bacterium]
MTTLTASDHGVFLHGAARNFTREDVLKITWDMVAAHDRGDWDELARLGRLLPMDPDLAISIKKVYGKDNLLARGHDLTEADLKFGKGWLDEP